MPRAAHICKAYPRSQDPPGEVVAERRRIMRRGIRFGHSFRHGGAADSPYAPQPEFPNDRRLCFACYQRSIAEQFEFIQQSWVNAGDFPEAGDGVDPIISQTTPEQQFHLPPNADPVALAKQWVKTTGGEYSSRPRSALKRLAG